LQYLYGAIIRIAETIADNATPPDNEIAAIKIFYRFYQLIQSISNAATISFTLQQSQKAIPAGRQVSVNIYDMNGRLIKTFADTQMQAGTHQLTWDARDEKGKPVSTGIYLLKMQAGNFMFVW